MSNREEDVEDVPVQQEPETHKERQDEADQNQIKEENTESLTQTDNEQPIAMETDEHAGGEKSDENNDQNHREDEKMDVTPQDRDVEGNDKDHSEKDAKDDENAMSKKNESTVGTCMDIERRDEDSQKSNKVPSPSSITDDDSSQDEATGLSETKGTSPTGSDAKDTTAKHDTTNKQKSPPPYEDTDPYRGMMTRSKTRAKRKFELPTVNHWSLRDTEEYRKGYPYQHIYPDVEDNFLFYTNQRPCEPDGVYIDEVHETWWGNYQLLEWNHQYIQWLFPIRERGMNWQASPLQPHEIEKILENKEAHKRILTSYKMMLDFYGLKLENEETGEVARTDRWEERFRHLNHSTHNYLRITRILKCLGEFEYEHLKAPFVRHILYEAICERTLDNTLNSCVNYWVMVIKDDKEREQVLSYAKKLVDQVNSSDSQV